MKGVPRGVGEMIGGVMVGYDVVYSRGRSKCQMTFTII